MTHDDLRDACLTLYEGRRDWQRRLSDDLAVNRRTVRRWASGDSPIPAWLDEWIRSRIGVRECEYDRLIAYGVAEDGEVRLDRVYEIVVGPPIRITPLK